MRETSGRTSQFEVSQRFWEPVNFRCGSAIKFWANAWVTIAKKKMKEREDARDGRRRKKFYRLQFFFSSELSKSVWYSRSSFDQSIQNEKTFGWLNYKYEFIYDFRFKQFQLQKNKSICHFCLRIWDLSAVLNDRQARFLHLW